MNQKEMQPKMCGYLIGSLMKTMFECKVVSGFLSCFQHPNGSQYTPNHHPKKHKFTIRAAQKFHLAAMRCRVFPQIQSFSWLIRGLILLMAEILHHLDQLIGSLSHYLQGFIHARWCRISAINSRTLFFLDVLISALFFSGGKLRWENQVVGGSNSPWFKPLMMGVFQIIFFVCWDESAQFAWGVVFLGSTQKNPGCNSSPPGWHDDIFLVRNLHLNLDFPRASILGLWVYPRSILLAQLRCYQHGPPRSVAHSSQVWIAHMHVHGHWTPGPTWNSSSWSRKTSNRIQVKSCDRKKNM